MNDQHPFRQVLIAIPAHDEQRLIGRALDAILLAIEHVQRRRAMRVAVGVSAHRCTDSTYAVAVEKLGAIVGVQTLVVRDESSETVGQVRHHLIEQLLGADGVLASVAPAQADATWVFSTDADSVVPDRWLTDILRTAEATRADAVAGMTELIDWTPTRRARMAYATLIRHGMAADGGHHHEYAANLAVRLDTYLAVGGFPAVPHGEERALLEKIRALGGVVATPREPIVQTSGRIPGRARHGLSDLLSSL